MLREINENEMMMVSGGTDPQPDPGPWTDAPTIHGPGVGSADGGIGGDVLVIGTTAAGQAAGARIGGAIGAGAGSRAGIIGGIIGAIVGGIVGLLAPETMQDIEDLHNADDHNANNCLAYVPPGTESYTRSDGVACNY